MEPREPTRRELRQQKRETKRAGNQRIRRALRRALAEDPEGVPDAEFGFGPFGSSHLNGIDRDATRRRPGPARGDDPDRDP